jgi:5'-nucleotidase (lipoprotein e(P4) family)
MKRLFATFLILVSIGCAARAPTEYSKKDVNEQLVMATLWVQQSAEYRALCYQAYNLAKQILDKDLKEVRTTKKRAVIVDGDESSIQANDYEASLIGENKQYPDDWFAFVGEGKLPPIPGAVEFFNYARSKGVETFYVTNRKVELEDRGTEENLKRLGFPYVDAQHLSFRQKGMDDNKQSRIDEIAKKYHLVMTIGDNLDDHSGDFHHKNIQERFAATDSSREKFGTQYIVLPNPMYGTWERAALDYKKDVPPAEQDKMRKALLRKWKKQTSSADRSN